MIGGILGLRNPRIGQALVDEFTRRVGQLPAKMLVSTPDLGRVLAARGLDVTAVGNRTKRLKGTLTQVIANPEELPFPSGIFDAVCFVGLPAETAFVLGEWARVVRAGGLVTLAATSSALLRRVAPPETMTALLLHAKLVGIEQRQIGACWLTCGAVPTWR